MIEKLKENKKIILSVFLLAVAFVVFVGELYAWFFVGNLAYHDEIGLQVVNLDEGDSEGLDITVIGGQVGDSVNYLVLPGQSIHVEFSVRNSSQIDNNYSLNLKEYLQSYGEELVRPDLDYDVYEIRGASEVKINLDDKEAVTPGFIDAFYEAFTQNITLALRYRLYVKNTLPGEYSSLSIKVTGSTVTNSSLDTFLVTALSTTYFVFEVNFDPYYYPTAEIDGVTYTIKNSNSFVGQTFCINLGVTTI